MADVLTGSELRKVFETKNILDKDIELMKGTLLAIGKTDLAAKLDKYRTIG